MDLKTYVATPSRKQALIAATGINPQYLWQLVTGWKGRRPSPDLARTLSKATGGKVSLTDLRPDIWPAAETRKRKAA